MTGKNETFVMNDYGKKSTFASFLPGIAGIRGIPIWCYYVNRGQCVVSFGVDNKDHAIMEFYPAHQAYQNVKTTGFRTFLKKNGTVFEPFSDENIAHRMQIHMNGLAIEEQNRSSGMDTKVVYYTLSGENVGALVRVVSVTNQSGEPIELELIDGMPAVIPYGVSMDSMKNMGQTAKAWMQVEDLSEGLPYYRVRASMDDTAAVRRIDGGNFSACCEADGRRLQPIVDPSLIFSYDLSLKRPVGFEERPLKELLLEEQMTQNLLPCSFFGITRTLAPGGPASVRSDMAPEISGIPIIMKILNAHRLQQKRILIQLAVPAKCRRHRAFDTTLPCDREIQITVICRPRQRKNSLITDKLICILHPASFLSFFYYSKEKNRHKKRYLFF